MLTVDAVEEDQQPNALLGREESVPSLAVIDTGCRSACGGDAALKQHVDLMPKHLQDRIPSVPDTKKYVGIEGKAMPPTGKKSMKSSQAWGFGLR